MTSVSAAPVGSAAVPPPAESVDIPRARRELPRWLIGTLGIITLVVVWQILAGTKGIEKDLQQQRDVLNDTHRKICAVTKCLE